MSSERKSWRVGQNWCQNTVYFESIEYKNPLFLDLSVPSLSQTPASNILFLGSDPTMKLLTSTLILYCALASGAWAAPAEAAAENAVNIAGVALSPAGDFVEFTTAACGADTCHGLGGSSACNSGVSIHVI